MAGSVPDTPLIPHGRNTPLSAPSPSRQTSSLRLDDVALEIRQIEVDRTSIGLVRELQEVGMGIGILPLELRDHMTRHLQEENQPSYMWKQAFQEDPDTLPGNFPNWATLAHFREKAQDCFNEGHDESSWNVEVYHRLLMRIFRKTGHLVENVDFMACASARPHESYLPQPLGPKMVDFCLFDTSRSDDAARRELARTTPTLSVNHTDFAPLQLRPIVLGITTAPPSGDLEATRLQVGEWHRAQWRFLRSIVMQKIAAVEPNEATLHRLTDETLGKLDYIPGIITRDRVVLWTELEFGSTQTIMKSYQIVAGLRHVARWADDFYMPWFRSNCCRSQ
ncbi:hypothetical protein LCI18_006824 [Fusarium solani-melongenae]|uniref:Uncharacterized protein n=1 Tax=Fusarium solani subsp. cucurbitae TaxID=2747967 RepID=A0ACD3Z3P9_FUSSC|nr:hypothetical protein LCI18_006824 [Fusarium solani-melongenae]